MQIQDVTKRRDDEIVIHYIDDDGRRQSLRAYPGEIIALHEKPSFERVSGDVVLIDGKHYRLMNDNESIEFVWAPASSQLKCPNCEHGIVHDAHLDKWFNCSECAGTGWLQKASKIESENALTSGEYHIEYIDADHVRLTKVKREQ